LENEYLGFFVWQRLSIALWKIWKGDFLLMGWWIAWVWCIHNIGYS
jgi:hypothetical protein